MYMLNSNLIDFQISQNPWQQKFIMINYVISYEIGN